MGIFSDMAETIIDMDDAIETIYYTPKGGSESAIEAHVFRSEREVARGVPQGARMSSNEIMVYIQASDVADVNIKSDIVRLKRNLGDSGTISLKVQKIAKQDAGSFTLVVA